MLTPPLHTSASVPFRWEEEPGKPRPCTALITTTQTLSHQDPHSIDTPNYYNNKCLELPPRLQSFTDPKMSSPTTVLDGPYSFPLFQSSSFRFTTTRRRERQGSFGSSCGGSPERGQFGNVLLSNKSSSSSSVTVDHEGNNKGRSSGGFFGSWRRKSSSSSHRRGKSEVGGGGGGGSFVFSSSSVDLAGFGTFDDLESGSGGGAKVKNVSRIARNGSFSSLSQVRSNHFWSFQVFQDQVNGILNEIKVQVPWMPQACTKCNSFGHYSTGCHLNPPLKPSGQIWKEKEKGHALINSKAQDKAICSSSPLVHKGEGASTLSIEAYHSTLPQELEISNFLKDVEFEGQEEVSLSGDPLDVVIVLTREEKRRGSSISCIK
ncbi:hypothetical protein RHSIM_Rhsim07G0003200 [Rhododendron simsii]|uniref:Uncharacterized protein n=1 Tax=Rhododendron simsii TaxID=118357 RepID=A0A834LHY3_RHOSS|nr:hypothetical protein RHSIM_Rhsim07G0003200 [Rhododendron simsii]